MSSGELPEAAGWDRLRRPVWLFDNVVKRHIYANDAALTLWGAECREEFLARDCSDQSEAVKARTQRILDDTANGEVISERWTFYPHGEPKPTKILASTHYLACGRAVILMEAEALQVDADQARSLEAFRHSPTVIGLFERDGRALFRNPAAYNTFGPGDLHLDKRYLNLSAAEDLLEMAWAGTPSSGLLRAMTLSGERWMHTSARKVVDPVTGGDALLWASQDVTAQIEAELSLAQTAERAENAEARERRLTELSHEMRTPLNTILGFAEILGRSAECPEQADRLERILASGRRLDDLVSGMLADDGTIPVDAPPRAEAEIELHATPAPLRILYADDHENNRMVVTAMLAAMGWECDTVNDGAEAVERVQNGEYDLVLMDIQMPNMDGVDATRAIRSMGGLAAQVPIIALTANTLETQLRRYRAAGMQDCLSKPVAMAALMQTVVAWGATETAVLMGDRIHQA
ncbi:response regulator [Brevundimonas aveniformis]|uniref:response regulator n=1 Tax=Brevundimonas aveniformis TaxID=370977 RepID=UPI000419AF31|nr:response regulator [Brevundimonas aveniformis]